MTPEERLKVDWRQERSAYEKTVLNLHEDPAKELGSETYRQVLKAYRTSREAGRARLREAVARIVVAHMADIQNQMKEAQHYEKLLAAKLDAFRQTLDQEADRLVIRDLSFNLTAVRAYLDLTLKDVEAVSGLSKSTVHNIEQGATDPRLSHVFKLAIALGVHPTLLLMNFDTLATWSEALRAMLAPLPPTRKDTLATLRAALHQHELTSTYEAMRQMEQGEHPAGKGRSDWKDLLKEAAQKITGLFPSSGAALGAVLGQSWGDRHGAYVGGYLGHRLHEVQRRQLPESVVFPAPPVMDALERLLK